MANFDASLSAGLLVSLSIFYTLATWPFDIFFCQGCHRCEWIFLLSLILLTATSRPGWWWQSIPWFSGPHSHMALCTLSDTLLLRTIGWWLTQAHIGDALSLDLDYLENLFQPIVPWGTQQPQKWVPQNCEERIDGVGYWQPYHGHFSLGR